MRKFISGAGADVSTTVQAYLDTHSQAQMATLFRIQMARWNQLPWNSDGNPANAQVNRFKTSWLLTDWGAALNWAQQGDFAAGNIKHGAIECKIGLDAPQIELSWTPSASDIMLAALSFFGDSATSPAITAYDAARMGFFDRAFVWIWKTVMPTPGDANTYGACLLTLACVDEIAFQGREVQFKLGSVVDLQDQQVPCQIITPNSRFAPGDPLVYTGTAGVTYETFLHLHSAGGYTESTSCLVGNLSSWVGIGSPGPLAADAYAGGVLEFHSGPLTGLRRAIRSVVQIDFFKRAFFLYEPLPFDLTGLTSSQWSAYPRTSPLSSDPNFNGFPYVPRPEDSI